MKRGATLAAGIAAVIAVVFAYRALAPATTSPAAPSIAAGAAVTQCAPLARRDPHIDALRAHAAIGPDPAAGAAEAVAADPGAFSRATGLTALSPERLAGLHGAALEERLRALDKAVEGEDPPPPPQWFEEERTTLANRYFAENPSTPDAPSADLARKQSEYGRMVARHLAKYGETNLEKLAEAKEHLFHEDIETPDNAITDEEKTP